MMERLAAAVSSNRKNPLAYLSFPPDSLPFSVSFCRSVSSQASLNCKMRFQTNEQKTTANDCLRGGNNKTYLSGGAQSMKTNFVFHKFNPQRLQMKEIGRCGMEGGLACKIMKMRVYVCLIDFFFYVLYIYVYIYSGQ